MPCHCINLYGMQFVHLTKSKILWKFVPAEVSWEISGSPTHIDYGTEPTGIIMAASTEKIF